MRNGAVGGRERASVTYILSLSCRYEVERGEKQISIACYDD